jgi:hypothetical protein
MQINPKKALARISATNVSTVGAADNVINWLRVIKFIQIDKFQISILHLKYVEAHLLMIPLSSFHGIGLK